ncbi:hypothetical protein ACS3YM_05815 [Nocardia sp. N13]|jgi:hypothetical protein|uniref:hypothetical protein n=1 Tax=Nocardioides sp. N13(2025) TaxID=3453405 RepID=UPI003F75BA86
MSGIVLRVRLVGGDSMDVIYEHPGATTDAESIDYVLTTLSHDSGVLRCRHGDRLLALYARGVSAVEVSPRGAIL